MRILVLGGDGYLGWPTAMHFSAKGNHVSIVDNYLKRNLMRNNGMEPLYDPPDLHERIGLWKDITGKEIKVEVGDCCDSDFINEVFNKFKPETVIHYAEIPSAPFSMIGREEGVLTVQNNLLSTTNLIYALLKHTPNAHIVKLGTMGEYGTPNIDIEEGWIEIEHKGRKDHFLFPRAAGSLYHTTKVMDTDLLWFFVRTFDLRVTDLMQGPVYGLETPEVSYDDRLLPHFSYDDIFGTVLNRFLVQAVIGTPLTVYGEGGQTRGYLNIVDTIHCLELAVMNPPPKKNLRILNQFTETFSVNELAKKVKEAGDDLGLSVKIRHIENPRKEMEKHYYNPVHTGLKELGLEPKLLTREIMISMLKKVSLFKKSIDSTKIIPRVKWDNLNK